MCQHYIWPWQHFGFIVQPNGTWRIWHTRCAKKR